VILSACESGLSATAAGDELMGLAASLLALGTKTLVASVVPVPDDATRRLMLAFHGRLQRGASPALALAQAQAEMRRCGAGVEEYAGFVCFGAG
jgi:CHAT domain-containing protein